MIIYIERDKISGALKSHNLPEGQAEHLRKKKCLKEANELMEIMEEISRMEQKKNTSTLQEAKKLAKLSLDENIKVVRFSKLLGEPQNRNVKNLENSTIGEPTLIPASKIKPERWSFPIIKNGILIGNIDIDKSTGRMGAMRNK